MTTHQTLQHKIDESSIITDHLIELTSRFNVTNREIASKCGVSESFVSRALNGKTTSGKQFLASLLLLKENLELRNQLAHAPRDFIKELEVMKHRIGEMERSLTRYPEHRPENMALNERRPEGKGKGVSKAERADDDHAATETVRQRAEKGNSPPPEV